VFAQITSFHHYQTCGNAEGRLGLGFKQVSEISRLSSYRFPTPVANLKQQLGKPIFSLYLDKLNGSPSNSEILLGGVDQKHYDGCLTWHIMDQLDVRSGIRSKEEAFVKGYWNFRLEKVIVGEYEIPASSAVAFVDSGSSFLIGPNLVVKEFIKKNDFVCYDWLFMEKPAKPARIDCLSPAGFDAITTDCQGPMQSLVFVAGGKKYSLSKGDITIKMNTTIGEVCVVTVLGHDQPGWILGDSFFSANYVAFDLHKMQVGLAPLATEKSDDRCKNDWPVDITNMNIVATPPNKKSGSESELETETGRNVALISGVAVSISASIFLVLFFLARRGKRRYQRYDYPMNFDRHVNLAIRETELPRLI